LKTTLGIRGFFSRTGGGCLGVGHRLTGPHLKTEVQQAGKPGEKNLRTGKTKTSLGVNNLTEKPD